MPSVSDERRPNILYICSDQHSFRFSGYAGHPLVQTPNLDRIAQQGVVFENAYCGSPVCVSSRASLMTGVYASDCDSFCNSTVWDGSHPTWGTRLSRAGYDCRATGKMDLNVNFDMGFKETETRNAHSQNPDITSLFRRPLLGYREGARAGIDGRPRENRHRDSQVAEVALDFITSKAGNLSKPWAIHVGFSEPHPAFVGLREYYDLYPLDRIDLPDIPDGHLEDLHTVYQLRRNAQWVAAPIPEARIRRARAGYYGMITELDEYIGQLWDALDRTGQLENTVFIYTSDHGESLGEHGLWGKSSLYEDSAHIPLVVAGPGMPRGRTVDTAVAQVDLVATMLDLAGEEIPSALRGHSLLPLIEGTSGDHPGFAYTENHSGGNITGSFMIRKGAWKYLHFTWYDDLLFNLAEDPGEFHSRIADPNAQGVLAELRDILHSQIDPEAATRHAFEVQARVLRELVESQTEDELFATFESRMGPSFARTIAAKCKLGSVG